MSSSSRGSPCSLASAEEAAEEVDAQEFEEESVDVGRTVSSSEVPTHFTGSQRAAESFPRGVVQPSNGEYAQRIKVE